MSHQPSSVVFPLSPDFPTEIGWTDTVRRSTTENPDVVRYLAQRPDGLSLGEDPATLLAQWWPSGGYMAYFQRVRAGHLELVVTDGVFSLSVPAANKGLEGLAAFLLQRARFAWSTACPGCPDPFTPAANGVPAAAIIHHLNSGQAHVASYDGAIRGLTKKELL